MWSPIQAPQNRRWPHLWKNILLVSSLLEPKEVSRRLISLEMEMTQKAIACADLGRVLGTPNQSPDELLKHIVAFEGHSLELLTFEDGAVCWAQPKGKDVVEC